MLNIVDAAMKRDRPRLRSTFIAHARAVLGLHPLQLLACLHAWTRALDVIVDVIDFGIKPDKTDRDSDTAESSDCFATLRRAIENTLSDVARDADLLPLVRIERMLVCTYFGIVAEHAAAVVGDTDDAANDPNSPITGQSTTSQLESPTIFFVDRNGEWIASTRTVADVLRDQDAAHDIYMQRLNADRTQRTAESGAKTTMSLLALLREINGDACDAPRKTNATKTKRRSATRMTKTSHGHATATTSAAASSMNSIMKGLPVDVVEADPRAAESSTPIRRMMQQQTTSCARPARDAALRFLRARSELDTRAHQQYQLIPRVLERELDAALPDLGMALALLLDGGGQSTVDEFDRRYPVLTTEIIFALRALLPLSVPRTQEAEIRRMRAFLQALVDAENVIEKVDIDG